MTDLAKSSRIVEDYLATIYRLEEAYGYARTSIIARELGVKPGTVSKILGRLEEKGFVFRVKYRGVRLTEKGRSIAVRIARKHRIAEKLLSEILGLDMLLSHDVAHDLEHSPDEFFLKAVEKMGLEESRLDVENMAEAGSRGKPLYYATPGKEYIVFEFVGETRDALKFFVKTGIRHGTKILVCSTGSSEMEVSLNGKSTIRIPRSYAFQIIVKEV